jgi:hypothetical protein
MELPTRLPSSSSPLRNSIEPTSSKMPMSWVPSQDKISTSPMSAVATTVYPTTKPSSTVDFSLQPTTNNKTISNQPTESPVVSMIPSLSSPVIRSSNQNKSSSSSINYVIIASIIGGVLICLVILVAYYKLNLIFNGKEEKITLRQWISNDMGGEITTGDVAVIDRRRSKMIKWEHSYRSQDEFSDENPLEVKL